ncbi:hypothetical protein AC629_20420 [Bradyrhizobium sp. NAS80.1]|uniref:nucleotidyltransferase family protein n=1 Tax=Bradyrhizobium sp. NAS80.1 TaxID=1680159 RepID=UPI00095A2169|nr:nucleotidyltransferase family protein [Bradyrhizobium sp. NAS80.1]OKO84938.1 hypothetical protein AC629_20420 [Bradyrhizobium sp. NAS80.1]
MDEARFLALALKNPVNVAIIEELHHLALPDAWLVAGCLAQTVWNVLTKRAIDPDTSWEAEDAVIRKLHARLGHLGAKVEIRNQARVHLWYPDKHGLPYPPLTCSTDGIDRFLTRNTQVGVRRAGNGYEVYALHGFEDIARLIARPNRAPNFSAAAYAAKAERWKTLWPEISVIAASE